MALDSGLLEKRILCRESFPAGASIEKCAKAFNKIFKASNDDEKDNFLRELFSYKLDMGILEKSLAVCDEEIDNYKIQERIMDERISEASQNIVALNSELQQEKVIRACREECEALALSVNSLPTRSSMKRKISDMDNEVTKMQEIIGIFESRIENRRKEFRGIIDLLETMQSALTEDMRIDLQNEGALGEDDGSDDEDNRGRDSSRGGRDESEPKSAEGDGPEDDDENGDGQQMEEGQVYMEDTIEEGQIM